MADVVIEADDATTTALARIEVLVAIGVQVMTLWTLLDMLDDGTIIPTLVYKWRRLRQKMHGSFAVKVPAWPTIYEAERIVKEASQ